MKAATPAAIRLIEANVPWGDNVVGAKLAEAIQLGPHSSPGAAERRCLVASLPNEPLQALGFHWSRAEQT